MAATLALRRFRVSILATLLLGAPLTALAAQRTFVSTGGNDANACTLASSCRSFLKAITVTDPNGELVVLDSGGYGIVSVNKNVTILSPAGVYAGISVFAATDGITVVAPATKVVLRGLTINGQGGNNGIRIQAGEVHVENVVISNLMQAGILVEGGSAVRISGTVARSNADGLKVQPGSGAVSVLVRDSEFSNHSGAGIAVSPVGAGISALVTVERSSVVKNGVGITANGGGGATATTVVTQSVASENTGAGVASGGSGATLYVRESAVTRNGVGLFQAGSSVLFACGANLLVANGSATLGAINTSTCLDVAGASGTVTNVATGTGLTGGPITTTGTINLTSTQLLPTVACATNQIPQWSGSAWTCAAAGGTGTVTSVGTGTGLTGGPITNTGTINLASTNLLPAVACAATQIPKWSGSAWTCAADNAGPANAFVQSGNTFGADAALGTIDNFALDLRANGGRVVRYEPNGISPNVIGGSPANSVTAGARGATIGGGGTVAGADPAFLDEAPNQVTDHYGTVGGGYANRVGDGNAILTDAPFATVGGGQRNTASGASSTVGGGVLNTAGGPGGTTVGGGQNNVAGDSHATVAGGFSNTASGKFSSVGGGQGNNASGPFDSTIGGGTTNTASGSQATVGGGSGNAATGNNATIGGGNGNTSNGTASTVGGGTNNTAGAAATVAGGNTNNASGFESTIAGGAVNTASGIGSTVAGGDSNIASGFTSFAAGYRAKTQTADVTPIVHDGAFVWADSQNVDYHSNGDNTFNIRAIGGVFLSPDTSLTFSPQTRQMINLYGGTWGIGVQSSTQYFRTGNFFGWYQNGTHSDSSLDPGSGGTMLMALRPSAVATPAASGHVYAASFNITSDRAAKQDFAAIDARQVLDRVAALPIATWAYRTDPTVRHVGPVAQDFQAAFGVGGDDRTISTVDAAGVALAAIQGLQAVLKDRDAMIAEQRRELVELRDRIAQVESLRVELAALKDAVAGLTAAGTIIAARQE